MAYNYADFYNGSWDNINSNRKPHKNEYGRTDSIFAKEPLNKPESSAIRLLLPLSLLGFPKALRVSRGLVQKFPNKIVFTGTNTVDIVGGRSDSHFGFNKCRLC